MRARQDPVSIPGVNVLRWELGNALRELRLAANMTVAQAATALECSDAKISRLENGQRGAVARDVRDLCDLYGVPEQRRNELMEMSRESRTADRQSNSTIPAKYSTYVALETSATSMRNYEGSFVPGLLQTEAYARAVIQDLGDFTPAEVEERVQIRLERQRRLTSRFRPLQTHFILDENVLWRPIRSDNSIREAQMAHLVAVSRLPNVTVQVVPYEVGFYPGVEASSMVLLSIEEGTKAYTACYAEGGFTDLFLRGTAEIEAWSAKYERMKEEIALSPAESRVLLMKIAGGRHRHWSVR
ncbi:MAG: helix-turn-helix domain-containing protein [Sinomonas sp.]|nr:helix-turn-helix domain-containing protein [Sinomonas sp.]